MSCPRSTRYPAKCCSTLRRRRSARRSSLVYCGDDRGSKAIVAGLIRDVGFEPWMPALFASPATPSRSRCWSRSWHTGEKGGPELAYRFQRYVDPRPDDIGEIDIRELRDWDNFYVIVGSGAAALIGLQFVVMTLVAVFPTSSACSRGRRCLHTPTIVHFGTALLLSALQRAPWQAIAPIAALWGLVGLGGAAYMVIVIRRMRTQTAYLPELRDWLFYAALPSTAYVVLMCSALVAVSHARDALFAAGTGSAAALEAQ